MIPFANTYARLPERMFARLAPTPVPDPRLITVNADLARDLGIDPAWLAGPEGVAVMAGNAVPEGAEPIAQAYAGHQFGGFSPQLGDGRAILLGEVAGRDIQLKGSGPTPFSRRGDGRAWVGPVLREYLVSEFMAAIGVPTTRALGAVTTGETIWREVPRPGAVLTRVAASHIRVGTFEYFAVRGDREALAALVDHVIARHHPHAGDALGLLRAVVAAQAALVAQWMALGFIHGVMNTDNMTVSGETIDYGPCAFIDGFHPDMVFSSIDERGRYRWSEQPRIAVWNLAQLASCLIPLMGEEDAAVQAATEAVHAFPDVYRAEWDQRMAAKLGLAEADDSLLNGLLRLMTQERADFTRVFAGLSDGSARGEFTDRAAFDAWAKEWLARGPDAALMAQANPRRIPRNHRIEQVIEVGARGDFAPFHRLLAAVTAPREDRADWADLAIAPAPGEEVRRTFCGT